MSDPLSIDASVADLITASAQIASKARELHADGGIDIPPSIRQILEQLNHISCKVQPFIGVARESGLAMISVQDLMAILSGSVLICSLLDKRLGKVAGPDCYGTQGPANKEGIAVDHISRDFWLADETNEITMDLQHTKLMLNLIFTIIQW